MSGLVPVEAWHDFVAGWAGGSFGVVCGHPLDTIKVRQQTLHEPPLQCLRLTLRYEGVRGLFKGLAFPAVAAGAVNSIYFGVYYNCLRLLHGRWGGGGGGGGGAGDRPDAASLERAATLLHVGAAGALGGLAQLSLAVPVDVVKIQLQTRTGAAAGTAWLQHYQTSARGPLACLAELRRAGGLRGCYRGLPTQLCRDVPACSAYFVVYEWLRRQCERRAALPEPAVVLVAGGVAGVLSWTLILPVDVVKSQLQAADPARPQYTGLLPCARAIVLRDGVHALFRGFSAMAVRGFVVNAATFLGYEYAMHAVRYLSASTQ